MKEEDLLNLIEMLAMCIIDLTTGEHEKPQMMAYASIARVNAIREELGIPE